MSIAPKNAVIESVTIGIEDHGFLTAHVMLNYGGAVQGFGGFAHGFVDRPVVGPGAGTLAEFVRNVLRVAGVERWEDLPGRPVRVEATSSKVHRIGSFLRDDWFDPAETFARMDTTSTTKEGGGDR